MIKNTFLQPAQRALSHGISRIFCARHDLPTNRVPAACELSQTKVSNKIVQICLNGRRPPRSRSLSAQCRATTHPTGLHAAVQQLRDTLQFLGRFNEDCSQNEPQKNARCVFNLSVHFLRVNSEWRGPRQELFYLCSLHFAYLNALHEECIVAHAGASRVGRVREDCVLLLEHRQ